MVFPHPLRVKHITLGGHGATTGLEMTRKYNHDCYYRDRDNKEGHNCAEGGQGIMLRCFQVQDVDVQLPK